MMTVFRFSFFEVFGGDSGVLPIWSGRSAVFGFVRICSGLFRFVRGALERLTGRVDAGGVGWWARLWLCCVLLGFGVGVALDGVKFWQPLSTFVHLASTFVKFWSALARLRLPA